MRTSIRVMLRQLAIALISACLVMIPMSANALGFGNIRIKSALNEPLDAEIELLSATTADLKGLSIKLAPREAFLRAGIERPGHLSQLKFAIKRRSNGRAYLQISTQQSVREPFLDFLLEMNWKNGRMLREYTVLLDPPDRVQQQPTLVESPQTESPALIAEQEQQQEAEASTPFVEPAPAVVEQAQVEAEPTPTPEPAVEEEVPFQDEPITTDSIAVSDVEEEPIPLSDSVSESDVQFEQEPVLDDASVAATDAGMDTGAEESTDEAYTDPFAGEKFPRIPITVDRRLREAEEAELAKMADITADSDEVLAAEEPLIEESFGEPLAPIVPDKKLAEKKQGAVETDMAAEELVSLEGDAVPVPTPAAEEQMAATAEEPLAAEEGVAEVAEEPAAAREPVDSVTVKRNDKLWNIAETMRPDESVSIYQVMMALLQNNPEAFVDSNVHRLKVGKVLRIDNPSLLTAMSKSQAAQEYIAQTQGWESYRQQFAARDDTQMQAEMVSEPASPAAETLPEESIVPTTGELVLSAPEGDTQTMGASGEQESTVNNEVVILREEIRQALTEAEAEGNKNLVLNEKLRDLESQLQGLQRSVTVQDDELATLQKQLSDLNKKNVEDEQAAITMPAHTEMPEAAATVEEPAVTGNDSAVMSEAELLAQSEQAAAAEPQPAVPEPVVLEEQDAVQTPPVETPAPDAEPGAVETSFGVLDSIKRSLSSIASSLPFSPLILSIGAGVIVVLLLLMLLLVQRRRQAANFQESILSGIPSHEIMASEDASMETNLSGESSFLSDFAISGASALQGDDGDVDPLTEADVFMAYGRYEAAEERILEAIKKDPDRQELRIKLLELYNTTKNKSSFESAAEELYANLGNDTSNPLWQKVVAMGAILAADNPLFSELPADNDVTRIRNKPDAGLDDSLDLGFEENASGNEPVIDELGLDLDFAKDDEGSIALDFDLDMGGEETAQFAETGPDESEKKATGIEDAGPDESEGLDFKFDSDESLELNLAGMDFGEKADDSLDLGLDLSTEETAQTEVAIDLELPAEEKTDQVDLGQSLDFNMSEFDEDIAGLDLQLDTNNESSMGLTLDMDMSADTAVAERIDDGLTMEMSQPTRSDMEMPDVEGEVDASDFADLDGPSVIDEVGTKLDLAKAYIDMGDPDGARSILDEVLEEGTAPQQQEAQQLMQQI